MKACFEIFRIKL